MLIITFLISSCATSRTYYESGEPEICEKFDKMFELSRVNKLQYKENIHPRFDVAVFKDKRLFQAHSEEINKRIDIYMSPHQHRKFAEMYKGICDSNGFVSDWNEKYRQDLHAYYVLTPSSRNDTDYKEYFSTTETHQFIDELLAKVENGAKKYTFIEQLSSVDLDEELKFEVVRHYPSFRGKTKMEAKKLRKKFLQKSVLEILEEIDRIPVMNKKVGAFAKKHFFGPFSVTEFSPIKQRYNELLGRFGLDKFSDTTKTGHSSYAYTPGATVGYPPVPDKEATTQEYVKGEDYRRRLYTLILKSEMTLTAKRVDKNTVTFLVSIDLGRVHKKYPIQTVAKYIEE